MITPDIPKLDAESISRHLRAVLNVFREAGNRMDKALSFVALVLVLKRLSIEEFNQGDPLLSKSWLKLRNQAAHGIRIAFLEELGHIRRLDSDMNDALGYLAGDGFSDLGDREMFQAIQMISSLGLADQDLESPMVLSGAVAALLETSIEAGQFFTPAFLIDLMVRLIDPKPGDKVCDPFAGSGSFLVHAAGFLRKRYAANGHQNEPSTQLKTLFVPGTFEGQEQNPQIWAICKLNMLLNGVRARIELGDTLGQPKLSRSGHLNTYDVVLSDPPFGTLVSTSSLPNPDPFQRFDDKLPPRIQGDLAAIQHILATLNEKGRAGVIVSPRVLFGGGNTAQIRKSMLEPDAIEAVINLPKGTVPATAIQTSIILFNFCKRSDRKHRVLFIQAEELGQKHPQNRKQVVLSPESVDRVLSAFHEFREEEGFSRSVSITEIANNDWDMNITRYIQPKRAATPVLDLPEAIKTLRSLEEKQRETADRMDQALSALLNPHPSTK